MKKNSVSVIVWITLATFLGKILGVVRDILISFYYGSSDMTDAFFLAMSIPTIILGVFTASTDSAVIPQYNRVVTESKIRADKLFSSVVNSLLIICGLVCILIFLFPEFFIKIFAMGFEKQTIEYGIRYLRIFAPLGVLHMLYCFFCTYNAAYKANKVRTILAFSTNLIVVCVLLVCHDPKIIALSMAFLIANILCAVLPMIQAHKLGYYHTWNINVKDPEYKKFWKLFLPIMGGALLNDIQQYVDKNLGSNVFGGISALNYASKLINIFDSIFVVGISVVLLPMLSDLGLKKQKEEFRKLSTKVTRYLLEILVPCFVLLSALTMELISIVYERGKFGQNDVEIVSTILKTYAPLIVMLPLQTIFSKFFHALEENNIPFRLNFVSVIINILLSVLLMQIMGLPGISLATTIAMVITIIAYVFVIWKRIGWEREEMSTSFLAGMTITTIISWFAILKIKSCMDSKWGIVILGVITVVLAFGVDYLITAKKDLKLLTEAMKDLKAKKKKM